MPLGKLRTLKLFCATVTEAVLAPTAQELAKYELTATQYVALRYLRLHERPTGGELAEGLRISHAAATKLVDRLEARGLVRRGADPGDRRVLSLELTPQGKRIAGEAAEVELGRVEAVLARMSTHQVEGLQKAMEAFIGAALSTAEQVDAVCLRCGHEHIEECPGNELYIELTGHSKLNV